MVGEGARETRSLGRGGLWSEGRPVERGEAGARNIQCMEFDSVQRWSLPGELNSSILWSRGGK